MIYDKTTKSRYVAAFCGFCRNKYEVKEADFDLDPMQILPAGWIKVTFSGIMIQDREMIVCPNHTLTTDKNDRWTVSKKNP